jgi:hypothetical protein
MARPDLALEVVTSPSRGLSNALWGGGIAVPTPALRRVANLIVGLIIVVVAAAGAFGLVVCRQFGVWRGVVAGFAVFLPA